MQQIYKLNQLDIEKAITRYIKTQTNIDNKTVSVEIFHNKKESSNDENKGYIYSAIVSIQKANELLGYDI